MKKIKVLWCRERYQQCLGTFTMLLLEGSSEAGLFINSPDYVFVGRNFGNTKSTSVIFFSKYLKFNLDCKNLAENWKNVFCCWDNCIWIGSVKLSLIKTGYFSSAANVLLKTLPKFSMWIKETFSNSIDLAGTNKYDKSSVTQISKVLRHVCHVAYRTVLCHRTF